MSFENNNNNNDDKKQKRSLYSVLDKEGFYIILFLCVCIVAVTAIWVSNQDQGQLITEETQELSEEMEAPEITLVEGNEEPEEGVQEASSPSSQEEATQAREVEESKKEPKEEPKEEPRESSTPAEESMDNTEQEEIDENIEEPKEEVRSREIQAMALPVLGTLGTPFADDRLVYHKTLDQWSTHKGVDIHAQEGAPVRAVLDGEVVEVVNDTINGITIGIAHDEDLLTRYCNLSTDALVNVGDFVKKGQTISGVGKTASIKTLEGPLLHFQVILDGKAVDPQKYLPKINN